MARGITRIPENVSAGSASSLQTFGPFQADPANHRLLRDGAPIDLRPQVFHVLRVLLENRGRYVDYEQMLREAWNGIIVSRHTVAVTVGEAKRSLQEFAPWITYRPKLGYRLEVPQSDDLIKRGQHFAARHTREGLDRALVCFRQAAEDTPGDFRAWEGISSCLLLATTWGMRPPNEAYPQFMDAHSHAVALRGLTPELRANRAHGLHVFERRVAEAEAELRIAERENPDLGGVQVRLAMLYGGQGRIEEARAALRGRSGSALDPLVAASGIVVNIFAREFDRALECAREVLVLHPYYQLARIFYANALEAAGRAEEAVAEFRRAAAMSPDLLWLRAAEGAGLARSGRRKEAEAIWRDIRKLRETEYIDAFHVAVLLDALGKRNEAFAELERAVEENSAMIFLVDADPRLDNFRDDPRFPCLRAKVYPEEKTSGSKAS
jgi:tetratricopeptide (TPR) repeat protein